MRFSLVHPFVLWFMTGAKKNWRRGISLYAPLVVWIGVIFFLSSGQGSFSETSRIIRPILEFFFPDASPETIAFYHGAIRKFAHFAEYFVLGILACRAFTVRRYILATFLVLLVAGLDETNQSFNSARTGSPVDVAIDLAGGVAGVFLYFLRSRKVGHRS